jgi:acetyltransferase-like isoleucine patch superfamily enzyme
VISVKGKGNKISSKKNLIEKTKIVINGDSNTCVLHENVKLRNANIIIRGNANIVEIGKSTTFGGVRIVNVGENNIVQIGEDCLFSDQIEIWASDTHSIYNSKNEKINPEKPIFIDNKVWIGSKVTILKGVKINEGAIVGMGTLVSKDVPKKTISVGVPNKVIKENVYWTNEF